MANVKISQLTPKGANLESTDLFEISEFDGSGYVTRSITGQEIIDAAAGSGVTSVTGTAPIASSGGTTPAISIANANTTTTGALTSTDWNTFNGKQPTLVSGTNIKTLNGASLLGSGGLSVEPSITAGTTSQYFRGDKTFQTLDKTAVGLANVDNTSDANKPVSTATQTALNLKQNTLTLTTTGTSGASTLVGATLNIPQYSGGGASGVHALLKLTTGQITSTALTATGINSTATVASRMFSLPFIPNQTFTCSNLFMNVGVLTVGGLARILIYSDVNGIPTTKLYESADLDCSTIGNKIATTSFTFTAGTVYWITMHTNAVITVSAFAVGSLLSIRTNGTAQVSGYSATATLGSAPTTYPSIIMNSSTIPAVFITAS